MRASRRSEIVAERRVLERGWRPLWLRAYLDFVAVAIGIGILAVAFASEVLAFVGTYATAKHADSQAAFGSDLRITPGDPLNKLPPLGPHVASVSPIRELPARAETDRKTIATIDLATYSKTAAIAPRIDSGGGLAALAQDPKGILIDPTIASDFAVAPGDNLPLTLFP